MTAGTSSRADTTERRVSTEMAAAAASVSFRQADYWIRAGLIPGQDPIGPGSGNHRSWTFDQVAVLVALGRFRSMFPMSSTQTPCEHLVGLAQLAHKHDHGFAVRVGGDWLFESSRQHLPVPVADALVIVGLQRTDPIEEGPR